MVDPAASVTAWAHEGIVPVELWDVLVDGRTLFARREEPSFYGLLASAVLALRRGEAVREAGGRLPAFAWEAVAMVGGALDEARARDAFDAARVALDVVAADPFFAASHAFEALMESESASGNPVVIDVGQTSIKASGRERRVHRERRLEAAPPSGDPVVRLAVRAAFVDQIAAAIVEASSGEAPSFVLLGLPCEVETHGDDIVLGASTYPTAGAGSALVEEILARAGCASTATALVNDAVLAAWALARRSPCRSRARLVLTLGLGVGAAVVAPDPPVE